MDREGHIGSLLDVVIALGVLTMAMGVLDVGMTIAPIVALLAIVLDVGVRYALLART